MCESLYLSVCVCVCVSVFLQAFPSHWLGASSTSPDKNQYESILTVIKQ